MKPKLAASIPQSTHSQASTLADHHAAYEKSHQPDYVDYAHMSSSDHFLSGSLTITTLFKDISSIVPHAGPLTQVLGLIKELIVVVTEMRDNQEACNRLIERILRFLKNIVYEAARLNVPLQEGTATAARLKALSS